jgi:E3 ubiquitin-protein ligase SHPRH
MPFTPIEEQHYQELFNQMCEDCGLDAHGAPILDNWDPETNSEMMRSWLVRLRQTALHPEVGGRNRRALGQKDGPLRTVDQVLEVMMEQADSAIRSDQRALLTSKLKRGQLYENSPQVQKALDIWTEAVAETREIVQECRQQLQVEVDKAVEAGSGSREGSVEDSSDEQEEYVPDLHVICFILIFQD